ncbi:hypothetical protein IJT17_00640 [bacterium]|nr:hypothetical protein [bacterium]
MPKNSKTLTLGVGDLYIDGQDVGYLGGDVTHTTEIETEDFESGVPSTVIKTIVKKFSRELKASLAQIDISTLKTALGIGDTVTVSEGTERINFGTNYQLAVLQNVMFVHTRDDGEKVIIFYPKAQVKPGSTELKFSRDGYIMQDITIVAVRDETRGDCPLGFVQVGASVETGPVNSQSNSGGNSATPNGSNGNETESSIVAVTDESVSGESESTWYNYQLAHAGVVEEPAPVVKSDDGNTTYVEDTDYIFDYENGIITTNGCSSTTLTGGATIKVSYSYDSNASSSSDGTDSGSGSGT